jgi:hypothetical protein
MRYAGQPIEDVSPHFESEVSAIAAIPLELRCRVIGWASAVRGESEPESPALVAQRAHVPLNSPFSPRMMAGSPGDTQPP